MIKHHIFLLLSRKFISGDYSKERHSKTLEVAFIWRQQIADYFS